jgi:hypothetical protein
VVGHQVEDQLHVACVRCRQQPVEILQRAKKRVDRAVVGYVITKVVHRRRVDRREPDRADIQTFDIIQTLQNAWQVANAVAVAVLKGARIDLIDDGSLPPEMIVHACLVV